MSDIEVVAVIVAKSDSISEVRSALEGLVEPTRAEEGCLSYELFESNSEAGTFLTVELWSALEDLDGHMRTDHIAKAMAATKDLLAAPISVHPLTLLA